MRITKTHLKRLINEEVSRTLCSHQLIGEINTKSRAIYGIDLSKCMTLREQIYIVRELNLKNSNDMATVNTMVTCGLIKINNSKNGMITESIPAIISMLRTGYSVVKTVKFWNFLAGLVAKGLGTYNWMQAKEEVQREAATACEAILQVRASKDPKFLKCMKGEGGPVKEKIKNNVGKKLTDTISTIFETVNKKFKKLITFLAAVVKFKTLKPSQEQKMASEVIAEKIIIFINLGVAAASIVPMFIGGGWVMVTFAAFLSALQVYGSVKQFQSLRGKPTTVEEAKEMIEKAKQEALQDVMQEAA
jgi:hypothetical protein